MSVAYLHYQIPDELHRAAKSSAALQGVSLKAFVEAAIEQAVATAAKAPKARKPRTK